MNLKEYEGYDSWEELVDKYEEADFGDREIRKQFRADFEEISCLMWEYWIKNMPPKELAKQLSKAWCCNTEYKSVKDTYEEAHYYCLYSSDRMNVSRWLRIRLLLNKETD